MIQTFLGPIIFVSHKFWRLNKADIWPPWEGRKSLFQVLTASVDSMSVYQNNPKCDAGYARAAHESQQITRIWPFWGLFGHNLPWKLSVFGPLEHVHATISGAGHLWAPSLSLNTKTIKFWPVLNKKRANLLKFGLFWGHFGQTYLRNRHFLAL